MRHRLIAFMLLLSATHTLAAAGVELSSPQPVPRTYFGLHIHRADQGTAWPNLPFGSWRLWDAYVGWAQLEPRRGEWDFSRLDRYVAMAQLTKVDLLLPLAMTPQWASARPGEASAYRPGNAAEPADLADWANYVRTLGERYRGKILNYEIWNEPSDRTHYSGDVRHLVELTCSARKILKAIDPEIRIVSPASAGGGRHLQYLERFLAAGGAHCIDVVAHHFYVYKAPPEAMLPLIRAVRQIMARNQVAHLPLWNTETGYWIANGDGTPDHPMVAKGGWQRLGLEEAGDYLVRALLLARAAGVDRFYWYSWDNRYGLGMLEPASGAEKPMVARWRALASQLIAARGLLCREETGRWQCSFTQANGAHSRLDWPKTTAMEADQ